MSRSKSSNLLFFVFVTLTLAALAFGTGACGSQSPISTLMPTIGSGAAPTDEPIAIPAPSGAVTEEPSAPEELPRHGLVVVAVGKLPSASPPPDSPAPVASSSSSSSSSSPPSLDSFTAARSLAKEVYQSSRLRPHVAEDIVQVLAGEAPKEGASETVRDLASLRGSLTPDIDAAITHALLESLANKVRARGFVLVAQTGDAPPVARLVRVEEVGGSALGLRLDPVRLSLATEANPKSPWPEASASLEAVLGADPPAPIAPRRQVKAPLAKAPVKKDESRPVTSSPWFWVIVGTVAAAGVTGLIVSQTVNTSSGSVNVTGKVLP